MRRAPLCFLLRTCVEPVCCERELFCLNSSTPYSSTIISFPSCQRIGPTRHVLDDGHIALERCYRVPGAVVDPCAISFTGGGDATRAVVGAVESPALAITAVRQRAAARAATTRASSMTGALWEAGSGSGAVAR